MFSSTKPVRHIRLLALGSLGDVRPYVALGLGLQRAGFDISLGTTAEFRSLVESSGLHCVTTNWDLHSVVRGVAEEETDIKTPSQKSFSKEQQRGQRAFLRLLWQTILELVEEADLLLYSFSTLFAAPHVAEKLGIPALLAALQPSLIPTQAFPPNRAPALPLGGWYNRFAYTGFEYLTWLFLRQPLNAWRRETLHLPPLGVKGPFAPLHQRNQPILFGFSPTVFPQPADWRNHIHLTGYWFLPEPGTFQPSAELAAFLQAGAPPISLGLGSMISPDPRATLDLILTAIKQAGVRAVLIANKKDLSPAHLPEQVFLVEQIPHDWLFPQMAATIHHGGAGTTAASLRAGVPTIVLPFLTGMDQSFWGKRVAALGVGPDPIPFTRLTAASLTRAIQQAISDETMRKKAGQIGKLIRKEDGVGNAVQVIEQFVSNR